MLALKLQHRSDNRYIIAITFMVLSSISVACSGLLGKEVVLSLALPSVILIRFFIPALFLWATALFSQIQKLNKILFLQHSLRALLGIASQYAFFYYLFYGSILNATLLFMTSPLFVPLLLKVAQNIPIQIKQWFSILFGFLGVILILQPSYDIINWPMLIGISSGLLNGGSQIYYHKIMKQMDVKSATFYTYTFSVAFALVPALIFWHSLTNLFSTNNMFTHINDIILLLGLAGAGICTKLFRGKAYSMINKASSLTPFLYCAIVFAGLFDWLFYHIAPNYLAILGAMFIIASGLVQYFGPNSVTNKEVNS